MSSCTVHPTYYPEGLFNVLMESAATGRPIITTNRPGCREVIEDGINGYLVKEKDSADLIYKIEKFLSLSWKQRRDMGLAGRRKVEKEFDRQLAIQAYLREIKQGWATIVCKILMRIILQGCKITREAIRAGACVIKGDLNETKHASLLKRK